MRLLKTTLITLMLASTAFAGVGITVNIGSAPYYGYPPPDVAYVQRYIPEYDMPRVFVIARYAHVAPIVVVDLYRRGYGWDGICSRYGVPMAAFEPYYGGYRGRYYSAPPVRYYGRPAYGYGFYEGRGHDRYYGRGYDRHYEKHWDHDRGHDRGRGHGRRHD